LKVEVDVDLSFSTAQHAVGHFRLAAGTSSGGLGEKAPVGVEHEIVDVASAAVAATKSSSR
jgi:hypothetical protein